MPSHFDARSGFTHEPIPQPSEEELHSTDAKANDWMRGQLGLDARHEIHINRAMPGLIPPTSDAISQLNADFRREAARGTFKTDAYTGAVTEIGGEPTK